MKTKLILLSIICLFACSIRAQESATYDKHLTYSETWYQITSANTEAVTTSTDSVWYFTWWKDTDAALKYDVKLTMHKISGTTRTVPIVLKGKVRLSDPWTTVATVYWTSGADTTKILTQHNTAQYYNYWQVYVRSALKGYIFSIPDLYFKWWK